MHPQAGPADRDGKCGEVSYLSVYLNEFSHTGSEMSEEKFDFGSMVSDQMKTFRPGFKFPKSFNDFKNVESDPEKRKAALKAASSDVEEVAPAVPVEEKVVVKEGRSVQERTLLLCGIVLLVLCGVASLYVALSRVIILFF
jgi:hypothetical protein